MLLNWIYFCSYFNLIIVATVTFYTWFTNIMTSIWTFILFLVLIEDTEAMSPRIYRITWRSTERCTNPDPPYQQDPLVTLVVEPYTKNGLVYFRGNLTIKENLKGYFWKIKSAIEKPNHTIKPLNTFQKLTCKSVIPKLTLITSNVKYNEQTCEYYKGTYYFQKVDFTKLDVNAHYFPIKEIGETLVFFSFYKKSGTVFCFKSRYYVKNN